MFKKLRALIFSEAGKYLIAGGLTTLLNLAIFNAGLSLFPKISHDLINAVSIIAAVMFAYVINSAWVFGKKVFSPFQFLRFLSARAASAGIELLSLHFLEIAFSAFLSGSMPARAAKLMTQVIIVIINYVFSKFFVFRKDSQKNSEKEPLT